MVGLWPHLSYAPWGDRGQVPYPFRVLCTRPRAHAHDAAASPGPVGHPMGKLIRVPWWWPDPRDIVPRVEVRISPYSGVHCNFLREIYEISPQDQAGQRWGVP